MRQRLVGALVLLSAGVVLWSILFTGPAAYKVDRDSQIPPAPMVAEPEPITPQRPDNLAEVEEPTPLPEPPPAQETAPGGDAGKSESGAAPESASGQADKTVADTGEASEKQSPILDPDTRVPNAWVIQVASFSNDVNAQELKNRLRERGYKAYVREAPAPSGKVLQRVFVGPELVKETALKHKAEIEREFKLKALLHKFES